MTYNPDYIPFGPNNKNNPYYKKINHVRLAKVDFNKTEFFGTVGGIARPVNIILPVISGVTLVPALLSADPNAWLGKPLPVFTYQWQRNGGDIAGATAKDYTTQVGFDEGTSITCDVTGTNIHGTDVATSNTLVMDP